jgi:hypothetical protein
MFLDNKYTRWYYNIINAARTRTNEKLSYTERHHIIPKSLGGNNSSDNLVPLTGREHFIVHLLLTKMCDHPIHIRKMKCALGAMMFKNVIRGLNSRQFEQARLACKGPCPSKSRPGALNGMFGRTHTDAVKEKLSLNAKERLTGKTYEEIMGEEKAKLTKEKRSQSSREYRKEHPGNGLSNSNADKTMYRFLNVQTDEIFSGTAIEFRNHTSVGKACCVEVLRYGATRKKWKLLSNSTIP